MTKTQKIIKYAAISLAIFLIVSIISGILSGVYAIISSFGLINTNIVTKELKAISKETSEISSLEIDLEYTNLYIKTGTNFEVQTNNTKITFENSNGNITIKEDNTISLNNVESNLIIYLPKDITLIDETNIETDAGKINIEWLYTKKLSLELGAGEVCIKNIVVTDNSNIDGGIGKTELVNCSLNNLKADLGVGEFNFNGTLTGKNEINSGIGITNIELTNQKEDYTINASKSLGSITIDGEKIETDRIYGSGNNYLDIDGGIGEIKIDFID